MTEPAPRVYPLPDGPIDLVAFVRLVDNTAAQMAVLGYPPLTPADRAELGFALGSFMYGDPPNRVRA